ncbi:glycerate kinase [Pseudomonadales bacterium]|nr:glycerate kinase [Pseudomonadales bacterium]
MSIADGGEYSHEVAKYYFKDDVTEETITVSDPNGKLVKIKILLNCESEKAYLFSSNILKLKPEDAAFLNPRNLTSSGLGDAIKFLHQKNIREVYIGLGGSSTIDCGLGMLGSLGVTLKDNDLDGHYTGKDLATKWNFNNLEALKKYDDMQFILLCDGRISLKEMDIPIKQKISDRLEDRNNIFDFFKGIVLEKGNEVSNIYKTEYTTKMFFGVAGGIPLAFSFFQKFKANSRGKFLLRVKLYYF